MVAGVDVQQSHWFGAGYGHPTGVAPGVAAQQGGRLREAVEEVPTLVSMNRSQAMVEYGAGEGAGLVGFVGAQGTDLDWSGGDH